jgi:hypothetical protein
MKFATFWLARDVEKTVGDGWLMVNRSSGEEKWKLSMFATTVVLGLGRLGQVI